MLSVMKKVLFVCVENSCRSQMAEAFAKILGKGVIESYSSGSRPSGKVNVKAIASMKDVGYDLSSHSSKSLHEIPPITFDCVVTMGCGDQCANVHAKKREDWKIADPKHMEMGQFNEVRDSVKEKVIRLVEELKRTNNANHKTTREI